MKMHFAALLSAALMHPVLLLPSTADLTAQTSAVVLAHPAPDDSLTGLPRKARDWNDRANDSDESLALAGWGLGESAATPFKKRRRDVPSSLRGQPLDPPNADVTS